MGNRIIKESIKTSDEIDQLSFFEFACFTRLIVTVDDYGRYYAKPMLLKNVLFPLRGDISEEDLADALRHFEELELIRRYTVDGKEYLELTTWAKHQTIRNKRSKFPGPEEEDQEEESPFEKNCMQLNSNVCKCSRNPIRIQSEIESESSSESKSVIRGEEKEKGGPDNGDGQEKDGERAGGDRERAGTDGGRAGPDKDRQAVMAAWLKAGFQNNALIRDKVVALLDKYGRDAMLDAIDKTAEANAKSPLLYVSAILDPEHRPRRKKYDWSWNPATNFTQREYSNDTSDMDRMMEEEMRCG